MNFAVGEICDGAVDLGWKNEGWRGERQIALGCSRGSADAFVMRRK